MSHIMNRKHDHGGSFCVASKLKALHERITKLETREENPEDIVTNDGNNPAWDFDAVCENPESFIQATGYIEFSTRHRRIPNPKQYYRRENHSNGKIQYIPVVIISMEQPWERMSRTQYMVQDKFGHQTHFLWKNELYEKNL